MPSLDPQDARQGKKGTPVLKVLIAGLILCVIGGIIMVIYGSAMPDNTINTGAGTSTSAAPATMTATPPAN